MAFSPRNNNIQGHKQYSTVKVTLQDIYFFAQGTSSIFDVCVFVRGFCCNGNHLLGGFGSALLFPPLRRGTSISSVLMVMLWSKYDFLDYNVTRRSGLPLVVARVPHERLICAIPLRLLRALFLDEDDCIWHNLDASLLRLHVPLCFPLLPSRGCAVKNSNMFVQSFIVVLLPISKQNA